ncbi:MAG TPA: fibronectin type III domain-containing protein, partial [Candidatus Merdibacter merdavium]|nr:fibronectin type III domain-containing protein [Candidatus Merdibacter merdavium]
MNTQAYTPVHAETQSEETETARSGETVQKSVILMIGSDETSRNLTWYANVEEAGSVQWAKQSDMQDGLFPAQYNEVAATSIAANDEGFYSNQATMTGLEENTTYVYRVVNGDTISQIYT